MSQSLEHFLDQVARRGSCVGGGSVSALSAALAAALLEKLVGSSGIARRLRRIRRACVRLIQRDAEVFARVVAASRAGDYHAFQRSLKAATEVPCQVFEHAQAIRAACRAAAKSIKPRFQSDLKSARAMAVAAAESARVLMETNLAWLDNRAYTKAVRLRLRTALQRDAF